MFIHLGNDVMVPANEIVMILDRVLLEKRNIAFAKNHDKAHLIVNIGQQDTKSVVITNDDKVYFSPFSTLTLKRRLEAETSV
ncbi:MAG TPA: extracellular matrix/biofilm biosynthesis regulator RemA family protein [Bacillales bacterium]|nr:extracellular matrix/biofilm biosynthesis regulator RemA family protein [Bacillales bacterium]